MVRSCASLRRRRRRRFRDGIESKIQQLGRAGMRHSEAMRPQGVPGNAVDCILGGGVVSCRWVVDALALAMVIRVANERQGS